MSFKGAKQAVTAFAPKIEAARPRGSAGADRCAAGGDRLPPRRRPPGAVGAEGTEAPAEAGGLPAPTASRGQTAEGSLEMVLSEPMVGVGRRKSLRRKGRILLGHDITVLAPSGGAGGRRSTRFSAFRTRWASGEPHVTPVAPLGPPGGT